MFRGWFFVMAGLSLPCNMLQNNVFKHIDIILSLTDFVTLYRVFCCWCLGWCLCVLASFIGLYLALLLVISACRKCNFTKKYLFFINSNIITYFFGIQNIMRIFVVQKRGQKVALWSVFLSFFPVYLMFNLKIL